MGPVHTHLGVRLDVCPQGAKGRAGRLLLPPPPDLAALAAVVLLDVLSVSVFGFAQTSRPGGKPTAGRCREYHQSGTRAGAGGGRGA